MVTTFNPYYDQEPGPRQGGINWKENWRDFFGLIILQTFDILLFASFVLIAYANLRRLDEKFVKLINVVRFFLAIAICCTFSWGGSICWWVEIVHWRRGSLMQMEFLKYCIIRTGDNTCYYLSEFLVKFGFNFYLGLFMGSLKCKFLFSLTAIEWDRCVVIN